jgi:hypothetical protein
MTARACTSTSCATWPPPPSKAIARRVCRRPRGKFLSQMAPAAPPAGCGPGHGPPPKTAINSALASSLFPCRRAAPVENTRLAGESAGPVFDAGFNPSSSLARQTTPQRNPFQTNGKEPSRAPAFPRARTPQIALPPCRPHSRGTGASARCHKTRSAALLAHQASFSLPTCPWPGTCSCAPHGSF